MTTLTWSAAPGAASYGFEVDYCPTTNAWCGGELQTEINLTSAHPIVQAPYTSTSLTFNFVGAQPGRWTVWAIDADGRMGARSPWQSFVHFAVTIGPGEMTEAMTRRPANPEPASVVRRLVAYGVDCRAVCRALVGGHRRGQADRFVNPGSSTAVAGCRTRL